MSFTHHIETHGQANSELEIEIEVEKDSIQIRD
jgi:hypothetical protein